MSGILELQNVTKRYDGSYCAVNGITISLPQGKIVGLLGPNGSGKTTLMKMIAGLLVPTQGQIFVDGIAVGADTKKLISYLPDRTYLDENQRISSILEYFRDFYDDFDITTACNLLQSLGLSQNVKLKTLSKGNREKVQLILVMSRRARLYLLDEPIAGVDPAARDYILNTILSQFRTEATVLLSTHLISDVENILDEAIFMSAGRLMLYNSVENLKAQHQKSVDEYFREVYKC